MAPALRRLAFEKTTMRRGNTPGIAAFASGLLALASTVLLILSAAFVLAVLAIILGAIGWRRGAVALHRGLSLAGVILGILSILAICVLLFVLLFG
jgi:hypothetical protein